MQPHLIMFQAVCIGSEDQREGPLEYESLKAESGSWWALRVLQVICCL